MTLTFIPKLVAMGLALLVFLPWMLQLYKGFFVELLEMIPTMLR
jgi:flagellar biosynthesis protein FliQ